MNKNELPCDSCDNIDTCENGHMCKELSKFRKNNPLSLRSRPYIVPLGGTFKREEYANKAGIDKDKKIKCPVYEKVMIEQPGQGDIDFHPTHLASSKDFFPEAIHCIITSKYICSCGVILIIPENKTYIV